MAQTEKKPFQKGIDPVTRDYLVNLNLQIFTKSENPLTEVENEDNEKEKTENANELSASLLENIHSELKGKEVDIAYDKKCSRIYERLLKMSTFPQLVDIYKQLLVAKEKGRKDLFVKMMIHLFASHVFETLLNLCAQKMRAKTFGVNESTIKSLLSSIVIIFQDTRGEIHQLIADKYASHVVRTLLASSKTILDNSLDSKESSALRSELHLFIQSLEEAPIKDLIFNPSASPVFQALIEASSSDKELQNRIINKGLKMSEGREEFTEQLNQAIVHTNASHFVELVFKYADSELFMKLYTTSIRNHMVELCKHPIANHVVQECIGCINHVAQCQLIFDELIPAFSSILELDRMGVILKLTEACVRFNVKLKELNKAFFQAWGKEKVIVSILEHGKKNKAAACTVTGSLLVQALFRLPVKSSQVYFDNFLSIETPILSKLACDPNGTHLFEKFFGSECSLEKKQQIIDKLQGEYHKMALKKYGSHCVENCFMYADVQRKEKIASELIQHEEEIKNNTYGKFVFKKCKLKKFKGKKDEWIEKQTHNEQKRALFSDILVQADISSKNGTKKAAAPSVPVVDTKKEEVVPVNTNKKRKQEQKDDEIDSIFSENFEKPPALQHKKSNPDKKKNKRDKKENEEVADPSLNYILQAIVNSKK